MNRPALVIAAAVAVGAVGFWLVINQREPPVPRDREGETQVPVVAPSPDKVPTVAGDYSMSQRGESGVPNAPVSPPPTRGQSPPPSAFASPPTPPGVMPSVSPLPPEQKGRVDTSEAEKDIESIKLMLRDYRTLMGSNPVGTNVEIMKELMGGNSRQATLGPPEGQNLNEKGELVDRWGTPYFFHQLSKDQMEIHSAGPDKKMGTSDDTVSN